MKSFWLILTFCILVLGLWPKTAFPEKMATEGFSSTLLSLNVSSNAAQVGIATGAVTPGIALEIGGNLQVNGSLSGNANFTSASTLNVAGALLFSQNASASFEVKVASQDFVNITTVTVLMPLMWQTSAACHADVDFIPKTAQGGGLFWFFNTITASYGEHVTGVGGGSLQFAHALANAVKAVGVAGVSTNHPALGAKTDFKVFWWTYTTNNSIGTDGYTVGVSSLDTNGLGSNNYYETGFSYTGNLAISSVNFVDTGGDLTTFPTGSLQATLITGHIDIWCRRLGK